MSMVLDSATEQRIQRQLERGTYRLPAEVVNRALDLLEADDMTAQAMDDWLLRNKAAVHAGIEASFAAKERGERYSPEEAEAILAERRAAQAA